MPTLARAPRIAPARRLLASFVLLFCLACAGPRVATEPASGEASPLRVGFVVVDGVYNSELIAPYDIFHHSVFHTQPGMQVFTVAPSRDVITSFEGLRLIPDHSFKSAPPLDVMVVPSALHSMDSDLENEALIDYVREQGARARSVISLCDGAFVLAQAGLLDGLLCTTFPTDIEAFRERFPQLEVLEGLSFVHDGKLITSAGGALSYDAALHLSERLWGPEVAHGIGAGLVLDWDVSQVACRVTEHATP